MFLFFFFFFNKNNNNDPQVPLLWKNSPPVFSRQIFSIRNSLLDEKFMKLKSQISSNASKLVGQFVLALVLNPF